MLFCTSYGPLRSTASMNSKSVPVVPPLPGHFVGVLQVEDGMYAAPVPVGFGATASYIAKRPPPPVVVGFISTSTAAPRPTARVRAMRKSCETYPASAKTRRSTCAADMVGMARTATMAMIDTTTSSSTRVKRSEEHTSELQSLRHLVC